MIRRLQIGLMRLLGAVAILDACGFAAEVDSELDQPIEALRVWHASDGVPSDSVTAVIQTRDGFLWLGCTAGLARFDGLAFTRIAFPNSGANHPVWVTALCEDSEGALWIGTQDAGVFQRAHGRIRQFTQGRDLPDSTVTALAADGNGRVWVGQRAGLSLWSAGHFTRFTTRDGLPDDFITGVNVAPSGTVWITTRKGMCRFIDGHIAPYAFEASSQGRSPQYLGAFEDRQGNLWAFGDTYLIDLAEGKRFNYFRGSESAAVRIWSLCEGRGGRLWIGTSGRGLFCFEDNRFHPVVLGENRWPYDVRALCEDREGTLWLGTAGGGLVQLRPQSVHVVRGGNGLPGGPPTALTKDAKGRVLAGLPRGGLFIAESGRFDRLNGADSGTAEGFFSSLAVAPDDTVWAGTLGDGIYEIRGGRMAHFNTASGLPDDEVLCLSTDGQDGLLAAFPKGGVVRLRETGVVRLDLSQELSGASVTAMVTSLKGGHWLGTSSGRILRELNGKVQLLETRGEVEPHPVSAMFEGSQGEVWLGFAGGGLSCVSEGRELNWGVAQGLPSDSVAGIVEDGGGNLWLMTGAGIYWVRASDLRKAVAQPGTSLPCKFIAEARTRLDSTPALGTTRALLGPDGRLWFATSEGLVNVDAQATEGEVGPFPVYLETVAFNGGRPMHLLDIEATNARPLFRAPVMSRSLEAHFTALSFTAPEELRFRHKLDGFDSEWVDDGSARSARYGRLPYGRYKLWVQARKGESAWQQAAASFAFVVPTPIYLQAWAIVFYSLGTLGAVVGTVRFVPLRRLRHALARLEQQQSLERERMRIARDMHDEIGSKLTKISFLSEHAQVDAARLPRPLSGKIESIAQTSQELLKTMDEIVWAVDPRNDTLESLAAYLSHHASEYFQNTTIDCQLRLPQEIPQAPLSSETRHNLFLAFEEALNNVLKHSGATTVKIEMSCQSTEFSILIQDNGKGFAMASPTQASSSTQTARGGHGLKNMPQRLSAVGGCCEISSRPGEGVTILLRVALSKTAPITP